MDTRQPIIFLVLRRMRLPLLVLLCAYMVSIVGYVLIEGVDDQGAPYRMTFFDAFYFVSFMGSTIGFGELPYPFTYPQRMWTLVTIYATVIAWLYTIGTLISLLQTPAFRRALIHNRFVGSVRRISEPFYIVCGAGDTGTMVIRALSDRGIRTVAVDIQQEAVDTLDLEKLKRYVPSACADASQASVLLDAGLKHRHCQGVLALSLDDHVNLKIALTSKLLNPRMTVIARAETKDSADNMGSFGTDHIINPFDTFAELLRLRMSKPETSRIRDLITALPGDKLREVMPPPKGRWIVCGFGRFGKALTRVLQQEDNTVTVIESDPERTEAPDGTIQGRGTEAVTLREAGIDRADALVAATDDDTNNLSILMTAGELMPNIYRASRQNRRENNAIFRAARLPMVAQTSEIIANRILEIITTPLTSDFLEMSIAEDTHWSRSLLDELRVIMDGQVPDTWVLHVNKAAAPSVLERMNSTQVVLGDLLKDPRDRAIPEEVKCLMLRRGAERVLTPTLEQPLQIGDRLLMAGQTSARRRMHTVLNDTVALEYCVTGERLPRRWLWRKLFGRRDKPST